MDSLICVENLCYTYAAETDHPIPALMGVDLEIARGEYLAIVGHNGSGKSTLARCLNGLLLPTRGEVWVNGRNTRDFRALYDIRATVGMVFQNPDHQFVTTVVEEEVAFGPENLGLPREALRERVEEALRQTGLLELRQRNPRTLSAGDKARLAIAAVLAMRPACLVLDEATAFLDPIARHEVLGLLRRLHSEGLTIVLITHSMNELLDADRVLALERGRIALDSAPRHLFAQAKRLEALGLTLPPAAAIAHGLRRRGVPLGDSPLTVEELVKAVGDLVPTPPSREVPWGTAAQPTPNGTPMAQVRDLHHTYLVNTPLATTALTGANLEITRGETAALVGPNSAGKSTLVHFLNGLLRPSVQGRVVVLGQDTAVPTCDLGTLRRQVGLIFQSPTQQLFERYVGDDIAYGPRQLGLRGEALRGRVRWAMEIVGLDFDTFVDRHTFSLSGGEMRRVAIAGVLAMRPELLVLDEATVGLDPRGRHEIHSLLRRLPTEEGMTILLVSNDLDEVATLADRVTVLNRGRTILAGSCREVLAQDKPLPGLGLPAGAEIARALRNTGWPLPAGLLTPVELEEALWQAMQH